MSEALKACLRRDLQHGYDRSCRKKGPVDGPNMAKVAVANKLAHIVYRLLVEERPYEER